MKKIMTLAAMLCFAGYSQAQTPPTDVASAAIENIPTVPIAQEKVGVSVGAIMEGGSTFRNSEIVDFTIGKGFFVGGEITAASGATSVLDSAGLRVGFSKTWERAKAYGFAGVRRDWDKASWQGLGGVGIAYTPFDNGVLKNFSVVLEQRIVASANELKTKVPTETFTGLRYSF